MNAGTRTAWQALKSLVKRSVVKRVKVNTDPNFTPQFGKPVVPPYFRGFYETLDQARAGLSNPYNENAWLETAEHVVSRLKVSTQDKYSSIDAHLLPLLTLISKTASQQSHLTLLDFGGGLGDNLFQIYGRLPKSLARRVSYCIHDTPANIEHARASLKGLDIDIQFATENELASRRFDISMFCGSLMYVDNWRQTISTVAAQTDQALYVTRSPTNPDVPTYYVRQLLVPSIGPWAGRYIGTVAMAVINSGELHSLAETAGFKEAFFAKLFSYEQNMSTFVPPRGGLMQAMGLYTCNPTI